MIQEEGNFILAKIEWAISGAATINQPTIGNSGSLLSVNKVTGLDINNQPVIKPVTISLSGNDVALGYPNDPLPNTFTLNNSNVQANNVIYTHDAASGNGINAEDIKASFTITARTPTGAIISQDFSSTSYLRK